MRMTKLIGNWDFFKVTLRYGYFDEANKKELVKAKAITSYGRMP